MPQYFATVARSLEETAARELERLGATQVQPEFTGVRFRGDRELLYRVNLWARTIFRVLVPIYEFPCRDRKSLYKGIREIDWDRYLYPENTFAVRATGKNKQLNHTHFTALEVKNAIVDGQRDRTGNRSSIDINRPDLSINVHVHKNRCIVSLDSSGESLHRRGYRPAVGWAPLKETLAAALLDLAEWHPHLPFLDPMCGSGTLPIEAAMQSCQIAPGLFRKKFPFTNWPDFDASLWKKVYQEAIDCQRNSPPAPIWGSDRDREVLQQARTNASLCQLTSSITFSQTDITDLQAPADCGIIICNPPYGQRLGNSQQLSALYKQLGDIFKQRFTGWTAFIITGNKELAKCVGLKASRRIPVYNGSEPCTFLKYELY
ncbi:class I SAM-dependent RNA methyltransferase [Geitlerinema sp. PCC 9228]|jgi:putative N6-adenine-specific DNA methylase|uniref:THUMP domain-containing class I SAM-dependent RNA methyltransferase n=1 Tax=Geitlerinema sp. PCC 9228 TaxID=111611 RepID=UPI0008F9A503|nr:class I SAM-dependent RNA methyltransferase [Geitlerinema sp. PCC 9228]